MHVFSTTKKKLQGNLSSLKKEGNARLLIVDVIEARNILVYDPRKGTTDSYVRCCLLDLSDRGIESETYTTPQKNGTVNPDFNQTYKFGMSIVFFIYLISLPHIIKYILLHSYILKGNTYDLNTKNELPCVKFALFHKGRFSVSETPLGEVIVPLADIDADGTPTDRWYPIKKVGRMEKVSGEVYLSLFMLYIFVKYIYFSSFHYILLLTHTLFLSFYCLFVSAPFEASVFRQSRRVERCRVG